jgi:hypothetical protein
MKNLMKWQLEEGVDFLSKSSARKVSKVMVSPDVEDSFVKFLVKNEIKHEMTVNNVGRSLQQLNMRNLKAKEKFSESNEPNFDLYWSFEEMEAYSIRLAQQYPSLVNRDVIGKSIEGRNIFGMRISSGSEFGKKPIIFIGLLFTLNYK